MDSGGTPDIAAKYIKDFHLLVSKGVSIPCNFFSVTTPCLLLYSISNPVPLL
jgi:hypothetical protein